MERTFSAQPKQNISYMRAGMRSELGSGVPFCAKN